MGQGGRGGHGEARGRGVRGSAFGGDVAGEVAVPFRPRIVHPYSRNHPPTAQAVATWLLVARAVGSRQTHPISSTGGSTLGLAPPGLGDRFASGRRRLP